MHTYIHTVYSPFITSTTRGFFHVAHAQSRVGITFSMRGDNLCHAWACGECCAPRPRVVNYGKPEIEYFNTVSARKLCLLYCMYVLILTQLLKHVRVFLMQGNSVLTMPVRNQSTLTAEESAMLQSSKEYSFYICFMFTPSFIAYIRS